MELSPQVGRDIYLWQVGSEEDKPVVRPVKQPQTVTAVVPETTVEDTPVEQQIQEEARTEEIDECGNIIKQIDALVKPFDVSKKRAAAEIIKSFNGGNSNFRSIEDPDVLTSIYNRIKEGIK